MQYSNAFFILFKFERLLRIIDNVLVVKICFIRSFTKSHAERNREAMRRVRGRRSRREWEWEFLPRLYEIIRLVLQLAVLSSSPRLRDSPRVVGFIYALSPTAVFFEIIRLPTSYLRPFCPYTA